MLKSCITLAMSLCLLSPTLPVFAEPTIEDARQTQLRYWIQSDFWGYSPKITDLATDLNPVQRYQLYLNNAMQPGDLYAPTLLNVLPGLGVGSFIQGDKEAGGLVMLGQIAGAVLVGLGSSNNPDTTQLLLALGGSLTYLGFTVYGIVAPMQYRDRYNLALGKSLHLQTQLQAQQPKSLSWASATLLQF